MKTNAKAIRQLNDEFRTEQRGNGQLIVTRGISKLGEQSVNNICHAVMRFDDFTKDNDPYEEHDFGAITYGAWKIFWKIDYYNLDLSAGSEDPSNAEVTKRILTIMLAEEY